MLACDHGQDEITAFYQTNAIWLKNIQKQRWRPTDERGTSAETGIGKPLRLWP